MRSGLFVCILSILSSITQAQDLSPFYGTWEGFTRLENGSLNKDSAVKITISGADAKALTLHGEMRIRTAADTPSVNRFQLRLELKKLNIASSGFSFLSTGYTKKGKAIPVRTIYEIKSEAGKKMLLCYGIPLKRKDEFMQSAWEMMYVDPKSTAMTAAAPATVEVNTTSAPTATDIAPQSAIPAGESLTAGATLLFGDLQSTLTAADKNFILDNIALVPAADKKRFQIKGTDHYASNVEVVVADLNNDHIDEVFVFFDSPSVSGKLESSIILFVKRRGDSTYVCNFGTTATKPLIVPHYFRGYPDIFIDKSDNFPAIIYRWDGKGYLMEPQEKPYDKEAFAKIKTLSVDELGRVYQKQGPDAAMRLLKSRPEVIQSSYLLLPPPPKATAVSKVYGKKGDPSKFVGRYWEIGYYKYPYILSTAGGKFYLKRNGEDKFKCPDMTYNAKTDQLEGWVQREGVNIKIIIRFNYENGSIYVLPENPNLRGMISLHLLSYH